MSTSDRFMLRDIPRARLDRECRRVLARLQDALPEGAEALEVGSTAVEGVIGKGDIDVLVRVPAPAFDEARARIDALFPRNPEQLSNEIYQGYLVPSELDVAIQLTVKGGAYDDFVPFLELLRASPELVGRYNALKRAHDGGPMDRYREEKAAFIRAALDS